MAVDLSNKTIKDLFFNQIKKLTKRSLSDSFDYQHSEWWQRSSQV
ncbi:hypothetical protein ACFL1H_06440 [Nanoarchaeota archaeon]